ncbi:MAG: hypothetical protein WCX97_03125 [Candidatus Magasanikbacteria bacterium]|jgi:hypothetical protein
MLIFKNFQWLKIAKAFLIALGILVIIAVIFSAGMMMGFRKAQFSFQWGDNYHRMFGGPQGGWLPPPQSGMRGGDFINPNGVVGTVIKFDASTLVVRGNDKVEKSIVIDDHTLVMRGRDNIRLSDLKTDDRVVILGSPSSTGQIEAKLIRVFEK